MIVIKCKACERVNFEASEDLTGTVRMRCKRPTCKRMMTIRFPLNSGGHDEAAVIVAAQSPGENKPIEHHV